MGRGKHQSSLALIEASKRILAEIQPATVRAVCYQLFVAKIIPNMSKNSTARVSKQLTWAREAGHIDWNWIVDETREAETISMWSDPSSFITQVKGAYRKDLWREQERDVEVWSEKGTVRGTLAPVLREYGVTFRVLHGFSSSTAIHEAPVSGDPSPSSTSATAIRAACICRRWIFQLDQNVHRLADMGALAQGRTGRDRQHRHCARQLAGRYFATSWRIEMVASEGAIVTSEGTRRADAAERLRRQRLAVQFRHGARTEHRPRPPRRRHPRRHRPEVGRHTAGGGRGGVRIRSKCGEVKPGQRTDDVAAKAAGFGGRDEYRRAN